MNTMKKIITLSMAAFLLAILSFNTSYAAKPTGGGKGGKVTVEFANPNSAVQGEEPTVTITGSGFDDGSNVKFLVTGTTDESQIEVDSVTYISPSELRARIKTTGSTATVDYDIEVQATSGRKGKGTTLFKVQSTNPPNPAFAFSGLKTNSQDLAVMDVNGDNLISIVPNAAPTWMSTTWLPDGSGIIWKHAFKEKRVVKRTIKFVDSLGNNEVVLIVDDENIDPVRADPDTLETAVDGCQALGDIVYFIGQNHTYGKTDIHSFYINDPSIVSDVIYDTSSTFSSIAVSKDGQMLVTYRAPASNVKRPEARLEIRDLCTAGTPVLWSWALLDLGMTTDPYSDYVDTIDWSFDGRLVASTVGGLWLIDPFPVSGPVIVDHLTGPGTGVAEDTHQTHPTWSPDSSKIAFICTDCATERSIYVLDLTTRTVKLLGAGEVTALDWRDNWTASP